MSVAQVKSERLFGPAFSPDFVGKDDAAAEQDGFASLLTVLDGGDQPDTEGAPAGGGGQVVTPAASPVVALSAQLQAAITAAQLNGAVPTETEAVHEDTTQQTRDALDAWSKGPFAGAAMSTGGKVERPLQLQVVYVETHFAPVFEAALAGADPDAVAVPVLTRAGNTADGDSLPVSVTPAVELKATAVASVQGAGAEAEADVGNGSRGGPKRDDMPVSDVAMARPDEPLEVLDTNTQVPGTPVSVSKQISEGIARAGTVAEHVASPNVDHARLPGKLRILEIQLQPESLGSVTVRMQLKDGGLELHLMASRAETVEMIKRDREALGALLKSAGYTADEASIRVTLVDATTPAAAVTASSGAGAADMSNSGSGNGNGNGNGAGGSGTWSGAQGSAGDRSSGSRSRPDQGPTQPQADGAAAQGQPPAAAHSPVASGMYL